MTSIPTRPVDNVVIATKGLQDRNTNIIAGTTVENKGKLILTVLNSYHGIRPLFTESTIITITMYDTPSYNVIIFFF